MDTSAFLVAERALCIKRRNLSKEISAVIDEVKSEAGLTKNLCDEKKVLFDQRWDDVVSATEGCIKLLDDGDEEKKKQIIDLNYHVVMIRRLKEHFLLFEVQVERGLHTFERKSVEFAEGGTTKEEHELTMDNFLSGELTWSFV